MHKPNKLPQLLMQVLVDCGYNHTTAHKLVLGCKVGRVFMRATASQNVVSLLCEALHHRFPMSTLEEIRGESSKERSGKRFECRPEVQKSKNSRSVCGERLLHEGGST